MDSKHTPGPWEVVDRRDAPLKNIVIRECKSAHLVAEVADVHQRDKYRAGWSHAQADKVDEIGLANARLIAATPEMYESCFHNAAFCLVCNGTGILKDAAHGPGEDLPVCQQCKLAREALKKYHGEDVDFDELFEDAISKAESVAA